MITMELICPGNKSKILSLLKDKTTRRQMEKFIDETNRLDGPDFGQAATHIPRGRPKLFVHRGTNHGVYKNTVEVDISMYYRG